jgi:hypothetical protein
MSFAAPLAFGAFVLAAPVIILYILKVKRRRVAVPYLRLWEQLLVETRARSLFQQLKRLYSLLLQLLILTAIVMALTQPAFELSSIKKESIVLLLDTSASMQAIEDPETGQTRFDLMLERAADFVEGRSYEDEMMLVAVSDRVDVLCSFNRNTLRLRAGLEKLAATNRSLDVQRAYAFAKEVSRDRENPVILILSDGAGDDVRTAIEGDETAALVPIGEATANVGVTRFAVRKNTSNGTDYVLGIVENFGEDEVEVRIELLANGKTAKIWDKRLKSGEAFQLDRELTLNEGATLELRIENEDALAIDNRAWAVVRPTKLRKVVLIAPDAVTAEPFWIAFESMSEVIAADSYTVTPDRYMELGDDERRADVTICVDVLPEQLPQQGNLILMNTDLPDWVPARVRGVDVEPAVWDWDREHLLNRYLNYRDLPIPPARVLALDGGTALVSSFEGPLIAAFDLPERMCVYVAFDMTARLFPFRLAFPMLLRNAIAWFEVEEDVILESTYQPGDTIQPLRRIPDRTVQAYFQPPGGELQEREIEVREGRFYFTETDIPGGYMFRISGTNYPTAVNLFAGHESRIAPDVPDVEDGEGPGIEEGRALFNRDLWALLALGGLLLWMLEWVFYHRRLTE